MLQVFISMKNGFLTSFFKIHWLHELDQIKRLRNFFYLAFLDEVTKKGNLLGTRCCEISGDPHPELKTFCFGFVVVISDKLLFIVKSDKLL